MKSTTELGNAGGELYFGSIAENINSMGRVDLGAANKRTKRTMEAIAPFLDDVDFDKLIPGDKQTRKEWGDTYRALVAHQIGMLFSPSEKAAASDLRYAKPTFEAMARKALALGYVNEATLAGVGGVLAWGRQILATITRAFPRMIAPQLFPITPMTAQDARIYWKNINYGTAFASSTPNVSVGDRVDDLTKFNPNYPNKGQLGDANLIEIDYSPYIIVSAVMKRLATEHSVEAAEDAMDFDGTDLVSDLRTDMSDLLQWITDRTMINAALNNVLGEHEKIWYAQPTINSVLWANLSPSEKQVYNQTLWSDGANSVMNAMATTRYLYPNWCIGGPKACEALQRVSSFVPLNSGQDVVIDRTSIHDFGSMEAGTMRVLRDPQMTTNKLLFGYRGTSKNEPGIRYCPYKPVTFFQQLVEPRKAKFTNGAYTRFGVGAPDYTQNGGSRILAEVYGTLTIEGAY